MTITEFVVLGVSSVFTVLEYGLVLEVNLVVVKLVSFSDKVKVDNDVKEFGLDESDCDICIMPSLVVFEMSTKSLVKSVLTSRLLKVFNIVDAIDSVDVVGSSSVVLLSVSSLILLKLY